MIKGLPPPVGPAQFVIDTIVVEPETIPVPPGPAPLQCGAKFHRRLKYPQSVTDINNIRF